MWICFNDAFVSTVRSNRKPNELLVRARNRKHLLNLGFESSEIVESSESDYRFRVFVDEKEWADLVHDRILDIDYTNFKNSVEDQHLHDLYTGFWWAHLDYQESRYGPQSWGSSYKPK